MNRECCLTQVIKQIIKHHLWDLTVWLYMLELLLMVMLLVLWVFALEWMSVMFVLFSFLFFKVQIGPIWFKQLDLSSLWYWSSSEKTDCCRHLRWKCLQMFLFKNLYNSIGSIFHADLLHYFCHTSHILLELYTSNINLHKTYLAETWWIHILSLSALCWWHPVIV